MKRVLNSALIVVISFCLVAVFSLGGCSKKAEETKVEVKDEVKVEVKEVAKEDIKVGAILAVTGPASFLGGPEARTLEMMVEEINANGGINGSKIDLIIKDSGANPEKAISFTKQLIEEDKVFCRIILRCYIS